MNFIFAKLYEGYVRKNDSPEQKITRYIGLVYLFLSLAVLLPLLVFLQKKGPIGTLPFGKWTMGAAVLGLAGLNSFLVNRLYIRNGYLHTLTKRYADRNIHPFLLYVLVCLIPLGLLFTAGALTVWLNGGEFVGIKIEGLLD